MTHEPECPRFGLEMPHAFVVPCFCYIAEAAYQRGREDAVQSVGMVLLGRYGDTVNSALHEAVSAAARGDSDE